MITLLGGVDYIPATFDNGRKVTTGDGPATANGLSEYLINAYLGFTVKLKANIYGTVTYNYTDSTSDFAYREYNRNRISVGLRCDF